MSAMQSGLGNIIPLTDYCAVTSQGDIKINDLWRLRDTERGRTVQKRARPIRSGEATCYAAVSRIGADLGATTDRAGGARDGLVPASRSWKDAHNGRGRGVQRPCGALLYMRPVRAGSHQFTACCSVASSVAGIKSFGVTAPSVAASILSSVGHSGRRSPFIARVIVETSRPTFLAKAVADNSC